jgi:CheY-like chemotaxis protein
MDGLALLRALRRRWPDLPAVLTSGYDQAPLPPRTVFLRKPFALAELAEAVRRLASGAEAGPVQVGFTRMGF